MKKLDENRAAELFAQGIEQFNRRQFFESHESWEEIWLTAPEPDKTFLQGIIQVAAAFHHHLRGNRNGARSLLAEGLRKLEPFPANYRGLKLEELRVTARVWATAFENSADTTDLPLPTITKNKKRSGQ